MRTFQRSRLRHDRRRVKLGQHIHSSRRRQLPPLPITRILCPKPAPARGHEPRRQISRHQPHAVLPRPRTHHRKLIHKSRRDRRRSHWRNRIRGAVHCFVLSPIEENATEDQQVVYGPVFIILSTVWGLFICWMYSCFALFRDFFLVPVAWGLGYHICVLFIYTPFIFVSL